MFCAKKLINKKMDELLLLMKSEKDMVNSNIGVNWEAVNHYGFRAATTMRALRRLNKMLKK
jgi:hypothetical protein